MGQEPIKTQSDLDLFFARMEQELVESGRVGKKTGAKERQTLFARYSAELAEAINLDRLADRRRAEQETRLVYALYADAFACVISGGTISTAERHNESEVARAIAAALGAADAKSPTPRLRTDGELLSEIERVWPSATAVHFAEQDLHDDLSSRATEPDPNQ